MSSGARMRAELYQRPATTTAGSQFADLAPEIQEQMYRRLGGMALLYAGTWLVNFVYFRLVLRAGVDEGGFHIWDLLTVVCVALGTGLWWLTRRRRITPAAFFDVASGFEILGGVGIYFGMTTWLDHGNQMVAAVGLALGHGIGDLSTEIVQPLDSQGLRLLYAEGLNWVAAWLLVYPLIVPMPMRRTVVVTLLTASVVPVTLGLAALVRGVPEAVAPWALPYAIEATVPTYICAGMAIYASRIVYRLTRDLSEARRMGNYRLVDRIGVGGMGEVWKARHHMLARPAAIKLIRPEVLGGDTARARTALKRFEREVQLTTQLMDPHTITIYDYGQTSDGTFFYVMELLEGIDLDSFVQRFGPAPSARVLHWLHQACQSLEEAHARGLTHRDIKPANLFTCRYGVRTDFLKVLDFGLVKADPSRDTGATQMTGEHTATGTPAYMPPEVALGAEADEASDIYALGCVAYWLLTGQQVFEGESAMELAVKHAKEKPIPPSRRTEIEIAGDIEAIVMTCLEKERNRRPASVGVLADRLAACDDFGRWTVDTSREWWDTHLPTVSDAEGETTASGPR